MNQLTPSDLSNPPGPKQLKSTPRNRDEQIPAGCDLATYSWHYSANVLALGCFLYDLVEEEPRNRGSYGAVPFPVNLAPFHVERRIQR